MARRRFRRKRRKTKNLKSTIRKTVRNELGKTEEIHRLDTTIDESAISTTATITAITAVAAGDDRTHRNGIEAVGKTLTCRYLLTSADTTNIVRILVVRWWDSVTPTLANILENTTTISFALISPYQAEPTHRYKVLYDKVHRMSNALDTHQALGRFSIKLNNSRFKWTSTASTTERDPIYLMAISDSGAVTHPTLSAIIRFRFTP